MLQSLWPVTTTVELLELCRHRKWKEVLERAMSHPSEAAPTEACWRGEGSTALSMAVRMGAPQSVINALLSANIQQIYATNRLRGSILHEALRHRSLGDEFDILLSKVVEKNGHQKTKFTVKSDERRPKEVYRQNTGKQDFVDEQRPIDEHTEHDPCANLLLVQDYLGKTVLHYLVEQLKQDPRETKMVGASPSQFVSIILEACPQAAMVTDGDGNTPLLSLLLLDRFHVIGSQESGLEAQILQVVAVMLSRCPSAVCISRKFPQPWRYHGVSYYGCQLLNPQTHKTARLIEGSMTPLYFSLLNGRSADTIRLILRTNRLLGMCGSAAIVSLHGEVCLHIAVTTRAPTIVLRDIVDDSPESVLVRDAYGLSSSDWLWICYVRDSFADSTVDFVANRVISRRRFLSAEFLQRHDLASSTESIDKALLCDPNPKSQDQSLGQSIAIQHLLERMRVLLPQYAALISAKETSVHAKEWSTLHACCYVSCPIGMIRVLLQADPEACRKDLRRKDYMHGRYPLHYAAENCAGYTARLPIGVTQKIESLTEEPCLVLKEILQRYPRACMEMDRHGQLPLHILIDAAKNTREEKQRYYNRVVDGSLELHSINLLLAEYPSALSTIDGKTKMFPWQQAAVGPHARLDTVYSLLRREPSLLSIEPWPLITFCCTCSRSL